MPRSKSASTIPTTSQQLADFAARLRVGQACEAGCGQDAEWSAVAPRLTRFGCHQHIADLLDHKYIWFLHPLSSAA